MSKPDDGPVPGLGDLYADRDPPKEWEDAVVQRLHAEALLGGRRATRRGVAGGWARAAAVLVLVGAGYLLGRVTPEAPGPDRVVGADSTFMLLLWEDDGFAPGASPAEVATEYVAWAQEAGRSGALVDGDELSPARVVVGATPESSIAPGLMGGYFLVQGTMEEALRLAEGHPHVGYGGWIEVAPVVQR